MDCKCFLSIKAKNEALLAQGKSDNADGRKKTPHAEDDSGRALLFAQPNNAP